MACSFAPVFALLVLAADEKCLYPFPGRLPAPIVAAEDDDTIRKLKIERHNTLRLAVHAFDSRRFVRGDWAAEDHAPHYAALDKFLEARLELSGTDEKKLQVLEWGASYAKYFYERPDRCDLGSPALLPKARAHAAEWQARLEEFKLTMKK